MQDSHHWDWNLKCRSFWAQLSVQLHWLYVQQVGLSPDINIHGVLKAENHKKNLNNRISIWKNNYLPTMFLRIKIKTTHWKAYCREETPTHHIQWQSSPSIPPKSKIITLPIRHLTATCYARKQKSNIYKLLNERKCNWGILDSASLSFNYKGHSKISYKYAKLQGVLYPGGFLRNGLENEFMASKKI